MSGRLIPIPLPIADQNEKSVIPKANFNQCLVLRHFIVEELKTARRYLRRLDPKFPIDDSEFWVLDKKSSLKELPDLLDALKDGNDVGLFSEAGYPGIADPGQTVIAWAQKNNISVVPQVGPSSIILALAGSGFNGQNFHFKGYIPIDDDKKTKFLKQAEQACKKSTQIFMDTPYRNQNLFEKCLKHLQPTTHLSLAMDLTGESELIKTHSIKEWKNLESPFREKTPALFLLGNLMY